MNFLILTVLIHLAHCGILEQNHGVEHHERATSYQNIHIEHFHPVPTFIRKEDSHLLQHPLAVGTSSSKVEIHHGDKHDHGYAFATAENNVHGHGFENFDGLTGAHEAAAVNYQVHDQEEDYTQYQGQLGEHGAVLDHYQLSAGVQGLGDVGAEHVRHENYES